MDDGHANSALIQTASLLYGAHAASQDQMFGLTTILAVEHGEVFHRHGVNQAAVGNDPAVVHECAVLLQLSANVSFGTCKVVLDCVTHVHQPHLRIVVQCLQEDFAFFGLSATAEAGNHRYVVQHHK